MLPPIPNSSRSYNSSSPPSQKKAGASKHQLAPGPPIKIAVVGATGSGKTSFINLASGLELPTGTNLESRTAEVQPTDGFTLDEREVILIDTPGFDDASKDDTDIPKMIAAFLATTYGEGSKLSGVIYIHRISDERVTGIAGWDFGIFRELCDDTTLKNLVLVTNVWSRASRDIGEAVESELAGTFFKPALDEGAQMIRYRNNAQYTHDIIRKITKNHPITSQIQPVGEPKDVIGTVTVEAANQELDEQIRHHQAEPKAIREDMRRVSKEKDEETRQEMEEEAGEKEYSRTAHAGMERSTPSVKRRLPQMSHARMEGRGSHTRKKSGCVVT